MTKISLAKTGKEERNIHEFSGEKIERVEISPLYILLVKKGKKGKFPLSMYCWRKGRKRRIFSSLYIIVEKGKEGKFPISKY